MSVLFWVGLVAVNAWSLWVLFWWLPRKRDELREISRKIHEWETGGDG